MDAGSFRIVQHVSSNEMTHWVWSADKSNVYRYDVVKKGLDGASFERLNDFWARDKASVFCFATQRLYPNIDRDSFSVGPRGAATDETFRYEIIPNKRWVSDTSQIADCMDDASLTTVKRSKRR